VPSADDAPAGPGPGPGPSGPAVPGRSGHTSTLLADGRVLVFGGVDGETGALTNRAFLFDPTLLRWEECARGRPAGLAAADAAASATTPASSSGAAAAALRGAPPKARAHHAATRVGDGRVVVVGGCGAASGGAWSMREVYSLDLGSLAWTERTSRVTGFEGDDDVPAARQAHAAVALDDSRVLVTGGWDDRPADKGGPVHFSDAAVLDCRTWTWRRVPTLAAGGAAAGRDRGLDQLDDSEAGPGAVAGHTLAVVDLAPDAELDPRPYVVSFGGRGPGGETRGALWAVPVDDVLAWLDGRGA